MATLPLFFWFPFTWYSSCPPISTKAVCSSLSQVSETAITVNLFLNCFKQFRFLTDSNLDFYCRNVWLITSVLKLLLNYSLVILTMALCVNEKVLLGINIVFNIMVSVISEFKCFQSSARCCIKPSQGRNPRGWAVRYYWKCQGQDPGQIVYSSQPTEADLCWKAAGGWTNAVRLQLIQGLGIKRVPQHKCAVCLKKF